MTFFYESSRRQRSRIFERWKGVVAEALGGTEVQRQLGELGVRLAALNEQAFLPNVHFGRVSVPKEYRETDKVAVLPRLKSDGMLRLDSTALTPTPARKEMVRTTISQAGLGMSGEEFNTFVARFVSDIPNDDKDFINLGYAACCSAPHRYYGDALAPVLVTSRPLIAVQSRRIPLHPVVQGMVGAHELVHALDIEACTDNPDVYYDVQTELRGYCVGAIIANAAVSTGKVTMDDIRAQDPTTGYIEGLRTRYEIGAQRLLNGEMKLTADNAGLVEAVQRFLADMEINRSTGR